MLGVAATATQARRLAAGVGYPVTLKIVSPDIALADLAGGIVEGVRNAEEVVRGFDAVVFNAFVYRADARVVGVQVLPVRAP